MLPYMVSKVDACPRTVPPKLTPLVKLCQMLRDSSAIGWLAPCDRPHLVLDMAVYSVRSPSLLDHIFLVNDVRSLQNYWVRIFVFGYSLYLTLFTPPRIREGVQNLLLFVCLTINKKVRNKTCLC